jgi:hypothetical protein
VIAEDENPAFAGEQSQEWTSCSCDLDFGDWDLFGICDLLFGFSLFGTLNTEKGKVGNGI